LWVLTAPHWGFGFTLLMFDPKGMKFEDYFGFRPGMSERQRVIALIAGIAPKPFMLKYMDRSRPDFEGRRLPSVAAAPFMIAGSHGDRGDAGSDGKGAIHGRSDRLPVRCPDALFRRKTYRWGMRGPMQRLKQVLLDRMLPR
jgi:hypothetical protein